MSRNNELIYFTYLAEYVKENGVPKWRSGQDSPEDVFRNLCRVDQSKLLGHIFQQLELEVPGSIDRRKAKQAMEQALDSFKTQGFADPREEDKYVALVTSSAASVEMKSACLSVATMDAKAVEPSASEEKEESSSKAVTATAAVAKASQLKAAAPWEKPLEELPGESASKAPVSTEAPLQEESASKAPVRTEAPVQEEIGRFGHCQR